MDQAVIAPSFVEPATRPVNVGAQARFETLLAALGKPASRGARHAIYNGDCRELLTRVPAGSLDLTFTSPPYNIGKEYETVRPMEEFIDWCADWINRIYRATTADGALLLNVGYVSLPDRAKSIPIPYLLWNRVPFFLQQEIVWNYGAGVAAKKFLSPRNEKLLWYVKNSERYCFNLDDIRDPDVAYPNQKKKGKLRCNTIGKNPSDVWQIAKVTSGEGRASKERTPHPAQFPLDLCERSIKGFSPADGIVLDPFLGSGSTIDACLRWERYSIGFEIREDYCAIAAERIADAQRQTASLF
ncbi:DNA-methyltransferase [Verminephrobacter aporrectodeae]|uniref:Methyltransferase n=1 Tax=Verminephrobacter aporrectodeae subsp. tuberculatae TaxID=1110392 RepID=A0ABT3KRU7_9BURK|nr:site-specific DNA-methyltransferase [Verminephrobacter aporrectodeae]MCW5219998.1 site-specific DNA-methyltransferase [Verminephrobacter aporrectodeae subsp. tuberculatae]MCW5256037.1 site-specific DNA-methyltransferase [Verminephrobacter aporrectodeae subsp. tuberculatae]MCW5289286.1 site-specific DNA-methyltransferase [Verminephrobacter aporrectodeae subsp. tuberculatae]MCW5321044.1 site-specific DNA-methyltransferase [Verminephrobacter aporrectodeae subsp. tuberculatae]MCW8165730.1 site-